MNEMKSFNETMAVAYVDYYNKHGEEKTYDFVLKTHVALSVLTSLYDKFILDGVADMATLPKELKEKFWAVACKHFEELPDRLKASKACYVLSLITAN